VLFKDVSNSTFITLEWRWGGDPNYRVITSEYLRPAPLLVDIQNYDNSP